LASYSGRGAGSYGALGGTIEFFFEPDPEILARKIMALSGYLENFIPPLEASREIAIADMQNHFDTESGPEGAWAPLSAETIKRWGEHPILNLTGAMEAAATSPSAYPIDGNDLFFSTAGLPFYAMYHESGRKGEFHHAIAQMAKAGGFKLAAGYEYTGGGMPPRPFIGISEAAQLQIIEIFDAWFEGGVAGFYAGGGGSVQPILRTSKGTRFGPKF
jgi:hypothetical protein